MQTLSHRISIFVPSTFECNKPAKRMQARETKRAAKYLCSYFGGCTAQRAEGYWVSDTKGLIKEAQNIVFSACTEADKETHTAKVLAYAKRLARRMKQEAITVQLDDTLIFVEG